MRHFFLLLLLSTLLAPSCSLFKKSTSAKPAASPMMGRSGGDRNQNYVEQFKASAILEMQRGGVPASITLAQGILESGAGTSELATNANNHFGIKCGNNWNGKTYKKKDDDRDENGNIIESCFRKYNEVVESYLDHAEFLRDPKKEYRYGFLFKLDRTDYKGWAEGLEASGYSSSDTYSEKLIDIIERYKLYEYDLPYNENPDALPEPENPQAGNNSGADIPLPNTQNRIGRINDTKVILCREGETVADIAKAYRLNVNKVADYNDRGYTPGEKLKAKTRVFIQPKKDKWSGRAAEHYVKDNQTMFQISQLYGVKLDKLLQRNGLRFGQEPADGERVRLKGKRKAGDNIKLRDGNTDNDPAPSNPDNLWPTAPTPESMTPDDEGYLPEIGGGEQSNKPEPQKPPVTTPEPTPNVPSGVKPPVVTGTNYPPDPSPNPSGNGWQNAPTKPVADGYHLVVKGDTLFSISRKYNLTVARLKYLNNMKDDTVKIGQTLRVK